MSLSSTSSRSAVTAYASLRDRDDALAAGFDLHLGKPVDPQTLLDPVAGARTARSRK